MEWCAKFLSWIMLPSQNFKFLWISSLKILTRSHPIQRGWESGSSNGAHNQWNDFLHLQGDGFWATQLIFSLCSAIPKEVKDDEKSLRQACTDFFPSDNQIFKSWKLVQFDWCNPCTPLPKKTKYKQANNKTKLKKLQSDMFWPRVLNSQTFSNLFWG